MAAKEVSGKKGVRSGIDQARSGVDQARDVTPSKKAGASKQDKATKSAAKSTTKKVRNSQ
jgi:hypothetical protein